MISGAPRPPNWPKTSKSHARFFLLRRRFVSQMSTNEDSQVQLQVMISGLPKLFLQVGSWLYISQK